MKAEAAGEEEVDIPTPQGRRQLRKNMNFHPHGSEYRSDGMAEKISRTHWRQEKKIDMAFKKDQYVKIRVECHYNRISRMANTNTEPR